ncbi:winged helix-turn-helix transcriptional regulator [Zhouia sp. PK063]|uniref:winged helix-turn-helix transcriptional regulator n=1 Tax=Zhouia sp. PK063 TaxID=3373602 RepID=UPI0037A60FBF
MMKTIHTPHKEMGEKTHDNCLKAMRAVQDSLYVINGKWKLPIIVSLTFGKKRFSEIARDIPKITDRMLSKELQELELNMLIQKVPAEDKKNVVVYELTEYGNTLDPAIQELYKWGTQHREKIKED